ncbi:Dimeric alpha-beta barrel [Penicillium concentricum]|uniref:Dimeric alpha-beta barrel n=1 Tax=Penicillium concentricum TaxID=293559 RepID=A0A9W9USX4_9EURO|nr:Dimeric alpha-beta barrel [Penicillium concentricum]KAJ5356157.1 Dimeric alpha-beta barrel [Penicillium concentricum]
MPFIGIVMYPNNADIQFDEAYYMKSHMPLVESTWKPLGLISWRVTKFPNALDGSRSEYLIMATLEWESEEALKSALQAPGTAGVFGDIPNFTNAKPVTLAGADLQK